MLMYRYEAVKSLFCCFLAIFSTLIYALRFCPEKLRGFKQLHMSPSCQCLDKESFLAAGFTNNMLNKSLHITLNSYSSLFSLNRKSSIIAINCHFTFPNFLC